ncbi:MAG TPA: peptidyl-alpha-hydroxyglycine alpha-amidating lyase family protein, partial [Burkholderiales bacterium]|nr:peptidyl-alpha-hydroxyglycine alpha-amidating lyase family protein [Burkholderiales bacterium]
MLRACRIASLIAASFLLCGAGTDATNDLPNPYRTVAPWGKLPAGQSWGAFNAVAIDNDGESVWVATRCGATDAIPPGASAFQYYSCAGSQFAPVMKLDAAGNVLKSFGAGLFIVPHKIYIDRDGNVWVADQRDVNAREKKLFPGEGGKGHAVYKFSPEGKLLMTIGRPGVPGNPPESLTEPTSIVIAPNGDIFISEGHAAQAPDAKPDTVSRISKFDRNGRFIKSFGKLGSAPGEFRLVHDLALDPRGRLFVADRGNMRVQILDQEGGFIGEWKQFSRPSGIAIRDGMIYVADSESNAVAPHPGWLRGIRVGSLADGTVQYFIPDPVEATGAVVKGTSAAEGIAVDAKGNIYGG